MIRSLPTLEPPWRRCYETQAYRKATAKSTEEPPAPQVYPVLAPFPECRGCLRSTRERGSSARLLCTVLSPVAAHLLPRLTKQRLVKGCLQALPAASE
jgi:hypothetical protein